LRLGGLQLAGSVRGEATATTVLLWYFSPTHSPNPSLAPPGERGELHLAASFKVGKLVIQGVLASK